MEYLNDFYSKLFLLTNLYNHNFHAFCIQMFIYSCFLNSMSLIIFAKQYKFNINSYTHACSACSFL